MSGKHGVRNGDRSGLSSLLGLLIVAAVPIATVSFAEIGQSVVSSLRQASVAAAANDVVFEGGLVLTESSLYNDFNAAINERSKKMAKQQATGGERVNGAKSFGLFSTGVTPGVTATRTLVPQTTPADISPSEPGAAAGYRTICVRLCDGYYWPISFSVSRDEVGNDKETCESSCGSPVKLYYYDNEDGEAEQARDLKGRAYSKLPNAFRYRNEYVPSCKCKPDPWEEAALDRHKKFAMLAKSGKLAVLERKSKKKRKKRLDDNAEVGLVAYVPSDDASIAGATTGKRKIKTIVTSIALEQADAQAVEKKYTRKKKVSGVLPGNRSQLGASSKAAKKAAPAKKKLDVRDLL